MEAMQHSKRYLTPCNCVGGMQALSIIPEDALGNEGFNTEVSSRH